MTVTTGKTTYTESLSNGNTQYGEYTNTSDGNINSGNGTYLQLDSNGNVVEAGTYSFSENMENDESSWSGAWYDSESDTWYDFDGNETSMPSSVAALLAKYGKTTTTDEHVWYTHNTACVLGVELKTAKEGLTDKWYNVMPVDLSQDGTQTFPMAASGAYYFGTIDVTVNGDEVTTVYHYPNENNPSLMIYPESECLMWFKGLDKITTEFLDNPTSEMAFGTAISKENDLGGQDCALLFICNRVSYRVPFNVKGVSPVRLYRNHYKMADYFSAANDMLTKVEEAYAANNNDTSDTAEAETAEAADASAETAEETTDAAETTTETTTETTNP